jgi:hypothetical protein
MRFRRLHRWRLGRRDAPRARIDACNTR